MDHCILSSHDLKITVLKKIVVCLGAEGFVNSKPPLEDRNFKFALWNACTDSIQYVAEYTAQMFEYQAYEQDCNCCKLIKFGSGVFLTYKGVSEQERNFVYFHTRMIIALFTNNAVICMVRPSNNSPLYSQIKLFLLQPTLEWINCNTVLWPS